MPLLGVLLFATITVAPSSATLPPRGSTIFQASGGRPPYTFQLALAPSGGSLAGTTYTAGPHGDTQDLIRVSDSLGDYRTVSITIGPGVSVTPATKRLPPHGSYVFHASGGSGTGYTWSVTGEGTIDGTGRYVASSAGSGTIMATDSLGNEQTALVTVGPNVALDPEEVTIGPNSTVAFAASGGSGVYTFALLDAPSGGSIDARTGLYRAGATANVTDVIALTDDLGNETEATIHVSAAPDAGTTTPTTPDAAVPPATTNAPAPREHAINLAGGGTADNACDCGLVGSPARSGDAPWLGFAVAAVGFGIRRRRG